MKLELFTDGLDRLRCQKTNKHNNKAEFTIQLVSCTWFEDIHISIEK